MAVNFGDLGSLLVVYGINVLGGVVLAAAGWWLAGMAARVLRATLLGTAHMDMTVAVFLSSLVYYGLLVVTAVLMLQVIGVQATSLVAVMGAASLAVGLALQGTLSNLAAGVMLLLFRPFRIGDAIEVAGKSGTVVGLNLFMTELASSDNVQVLIPNAQVWGTAITNQSTYPTRRFAAVFVVPPGRDVAGIEARIAEALREDSRVLRDPAPAVTHSALTDKGVELTAAGWTPTADAGAARADLIRRVAALLAAPTA